MKLKTKLVTGLLVASLVGGGIVSILASRKAVEAKADASEFSYSLGAGETVDSSGMKGLQFTVNNTLSTALEYTIAVTDSEDNVITAQAGQNKGVGLFIPSSGAQYWGNVFQVPAGWSGQIYIPINSTYTAYGTPINLPWSTNTMPATLKTGLTVTSPTAGAASSMFSNFALSTEVKDQSKPSFHWKAQNFNAGVEGVVTQVGTTSNSAGLRATIPAGELSFDVLGIAFRFRNKSSVAYPLRIYFVASNNYNYAGLANMVYARGNGLAGMGDNMQLTNRNVWIPANFDGTLCVYPNYWNTDSDKGIQTLSKEGLTIKTINFYFLNAAVGAELGVDSSVTLFNKNGTTTFKQNVLAPARMSAFGASGVTAPTITTVDDKVITGSLDDAGNMPFTSGSLLFDPQNVGGFSGNMGGNVYASAFATFEGKDAVGLRIRNFADNEYRINTLYWQLVDGTSYSLWRATTKYIDLQGNITTRGYKGERGFPLPAHFDGYVVFDFDQFSMIRTGVDDSYQWSESAHMVKGTPTYPHAQLWFMSIYFDKLMNNDDNQVVIGNDLIVATYTDSTKDLTTAKLEGYVDSLSLSGNTVVSDVHTSYFDPTRQNLSAVGEVTLDANSIGYGDFITATANEGYQITAATISDGTRTEFMDIASGGMSATYKGYHVWDDDVVVTATTVAYVTYPIAQTTPSLSMGTKFVLGYIDANAKVMGPISNHVANGLPSEMISNHTMLNPDDNTVVWTMYADSDGYYYIKGVDGFLSLTENGLEETFDSEALVARWDVSVDNAHGVTIRSQADPTKIIRYNTGDNVFEAGTGSTNISAFVSAEPTLAAKISTFETLYLRRQHSLSDADTGACRGENGYYAKAKAALLGEWSVIASDIASTSNYWSRFVAWGLANGEVVTYSNGSISFGAYHHSLFRTVEKKSILPIVLAISGSFVLGLAVLYVIKRRKRA